MTAAGLNISGGTADAIFAREIVSRNPNVGVEIRAFGSGWEYSGSVFGGQAAGFLTRLDHAIQTGALVAAGSQTGGMNDCEKYLAGMFGGKGSYFADGYGVDLTVGTDRENHYGGHLYGSQTDPTVPTEVFVPGGGTLQRTAFSVDPNLNRGRAREITQGNPYVAYGPATQVTASFIHYANLGSFKNVTLVVYHITDVHTKGLVGTADGRKKLGMAGGFDMGGSWSYRQDGKYIGTGTHAHIEIWSGGAYNSFPKDGVRTKIRQDIRGLCPTK